jgi:hypothetical protein
VRGELAGLLAEPEALRTEVPPVQAAFDFHLPGVFLDAG